MTFNLMKKALIANDFLHGKCEVEKSKIQVFPYIKYQTSNSK